MVLHTPTFYTLYIPMHHFLCHFIAILSFLGLPPSQMMHLFSVLNAAGAPETVVVK